MTVFDLAPYRNVVVLTGAGVSVASGLRPFRGPGGLWEQPGVDVVTADSMREDSQRVWALFSELRRQAIRAEPNPAHLALAKFEQEVRARGGEFLLVTQNVDRLHQRAGSEGVVEFHGSLFRARCSDAACISEPFDTSHDTDVDLTSLRCETCGGPARADVVLFAESIPAKPEWDAKRALRTCDLFLAVGTSGTVSPASNFVRSAAYAGARTVLVNLEPMKPRDPDFHEEVLGPAEVTLPRWLGGNALR